MLEIVIEEENVRECVCACVYVCVLRVCVNVDYSVLYRVSLFNKRQLFYRHELLERMTMTLPFAHKGFALERNQVRNYNNYCLTTILLLSLLTLLFDHDSCFCIVRELYVANWA